MKKNFSILFLILIFISNANSLAEGNSNNKLNITTDFNSQPEYTIFNINNISTYLRNNGQSDLSVSGNSGFEYPLGSGKHLIFESGFLFGGKIDGNIRIGGSTYMSGLVPGRIIKEGTAENPELPHVRIFKVRRDYSTADLSDEITIYKDSVDGKLTYTQNLSASKALEQYKKDWDEWPAEYGAPFEDVNNNGIYEPDSDIPGIPGADQTIWFVCNDLNEEVTRNFFGSPPMGIELQVTVWGYRDINIYSNTVFKKYLMINKSGKKLTDMYASMWSDPDVGDATDDYVGIDTTMNLAYSYNGDSKDAAYGINVPAVGFKLIQGPIVDGALNQEARIKDRIVKGKKNLPYTSFSFLVGSDPVYNDPNFGNYTEGTIEVYNLMQGKIGASGQSFINPNTGNPTKYCLAGDPVFQSGWVDGQLHPPGDRRMIASSGPFEMAVGDTQEIIYAQIAAGGENTLSGNFVVNLLKSYSEIVSKTFYGSSNIPPPNLKSTSLDKEIILSWGDESSSIIEGYSNMGYEFQGYTLYQLPKKDSPRSDFVPIINFDRIDGVKEIKEIIFNFSAEQPIEYNAHFGNDTGIERFSLINFDKITGRPLNNGTPYYFKLAAYTYNKKLNIPYGVTESLSNTVKVLPQNNNPGIVNESHVGDKLESRHIRGNSTASVVIMVIDPMEVKGHDYEINFSRDIENNLLWDLDDITDNITVLSNQSNINGSDEYRIVDGIRIIVDEGENNPLTESDLYRFTTPEISYSKELAREEVEKINVFPNPYYGYNPMETQKLGNFVMINHLPEKAVIRIFNLAGQLIRTLHKDSADQFYLWDLQNDHRFLVGSGLYIIHVEMPELGKVKVLKLAVILGTEIPDFY